MGHLSTIDPLGLLEGSVINAKLIVQLLRTLEPKGKPYEVTDTERSEDVGLFDASGFPKATGSNEVARVNMTASISFGTEKGIMPVDSAPVNQRYARLGTLT